jgi:hypothetical protein
MARLRFAVVLFVAACSSQPPLLDDVQYELFGAGARQGEAMDVAAILADPTRWDGKQVRVRGPINEVSRDAGWVRVGDEHGLVVKIRGNKFALPGECAGRDAVVEGRLQIEVHSVEAVRRDLESAGRVEEAGQVRQPRHEVALVAEGVAVRRQDR